MYAYIVLKSMLGEFILSKLQEIAMVFWDYYFDGAFIVDEKSLLY